MTKNFYFKQETIKRSKMYGYLVKEVSIYRLSKDGHPILLDRITYQTGSTPGAKQEVFNYLVDNKYIPQKYKGDMYDTGAYKIYNVFEMF